MPCSNCYFFDTTKSGGNICRAHPPGSQGGFPAVDGDDWCGEHSYKNPQAALAPAEPSTASKTRHGVRSAQR
jgi:hypothetical protein